MKTMRYILFGMLLSNTAIAQSIAPQTVNSTGGSHRKGNVRLDWNVGEMALVNTLSSPITGNIITNGVIQPQLGVVPSGNRRRLFAFDDGEVHILPNPTRGLLAVSMNMKYDGTVTLRLFDVLGNLVYAKTVPGNRYGQIEQINMTGFIKGNYMLKVELVASGYKYKEGFYKIIKVD
jgi:hypothetical protein